MASSRPFATRTSRRLLLPLSLEVPRQPGCADRDRRSVSIPVGEPVPEMECANPRRASWPARCIRGTVLVRARLPGEACRVAESSSGFERSLARADARGRTDAFFSEIRPGLVGWDVHLESFFGGQDPENGVWEQDARAADPGAPWMRFRPACPPVNTWRFSSARAGCSIFSASFGPS